MKMPRRVGGCLQVPVDDEVLVYSDRSDTKEAHCLDARAALVFNKCDGETNVEDVCGLVAEAFGLSASEAENVVSAAVERVDEAGLLEKDSPTGGISRREFFRYGQLAVAGVGVVSLGLPAAASAVSIACLSFPTFTGEQSCQNYFPNMTPVDRCNQCASGGAACNPLQRCVSQYIPGAASGLGHMGDFNQFNSCQFINGTNIQEDCVLAEAAAGGGQYFCCRNLVP